MKPLKCLKCNTDLVTVGPGEVCKEKECEHYRLLQVRI